VTTLRSVGADTRHSDAVAGWKDWRPPGLAEHAPVSLPSRTPSHEKRVRFQRHLVLICAFFQHADATGNEAIRIRLGSFRPFRNASRKMKLDWTQASDPRDRSRILRARWRVRSGAGSANQVMPNQVMALFAGSALPFSPPGSAASADLADRPDFSGNHIGTPATVYLKFATSVRCRILNRNNRMPHMDQNFEQNIRMRAYLLWEFEGCQEGWADQYWHRARERIEAESVSDYPPAQSRHNRS